jgi:hypothetical protein
VGRWAAWQAESSKRSSAIADPWVRSFDIDVL